MFATMKPYAPPAPPGAQPPPLWGDLDHVRALLGDRVVEVTAEKRTVRVELFPDGAAFRDFFKRTYGPTIAAYRALAEDPARIEELDAALAALADDALRDGSIDGAMEWEYLLCYASRA